MDSNPLGDDWKDLWKKDIHPFAITENIVIKPTWEDYSPKTDELVIEIDPGMAFGTGSHETTRGCVQLLAQNIKDGHDVLDIGTGSGILAMVSVLCGAKRVDACDIDAVAIEVAEENLKSNKLEDRINLSITDILKNEIKEKYHIVVSNLTSGIIIEMLPHVRKLLQNDGKIILSGMLLEEKDRMIEVFSQNALSVNEEIIDGEWYTVLLS
jgi:ribosomal protein L11 methyltransferase